MSLIIKYKDFLNENNVIFRTQITSEEKDLLQRHEILDYKYNPNTQLIDVYQDVILSNKRISELPDIRFGIVYGDFYCSNNGLTTLKYCPKKVTRSFFGHNNHLTSLEYCPKEVGGEFICFQNKLVSLKHCPIEVSSFNCSNNLLTSLEGCPQKKIKYNFSCVNNKLTSLDFCPKEVGGNFNLYDNGLSSIEDYPLCIIKGNIDYSSVTKNKTSNFPLKFFSRVHEIVKKNEEIFENLLDDKIKFHQMIMRLEPDLIKYYTSIPPPTKKSTLLI